MTWKSHPSEANNNNTVLAIGHKLYTNKVLEY